LESGLSHPLREKPISGTIVKDSQLLAPLKLRGQRFDKPLRSTAGVLGINLGIVAIVNVTAEIVMSPIVEEVGEQKTAKLTLEIRNSYARPSESVELGLGTATFIEIQNIEKDTALAAYLAQGRTP
jgi:hypothetical protein